MAEVCTVFRFTCPLPPRELHPNGRTGNWQQRNRLTAEYRSDVAACVGTAGWAKARFEWAWIDLEYVMRNARLADDDGLVAWWKAGRDAIADCGLVRNDRYLRVRTVTARKAERGAQLGVTATLERVEE